MHLIFSHGIIISLAEEKKPKSLLVPGTIIEVIAPESKLAVTSWTKPRRLPSVILITSLCLKSSPFAPITTTLSKENNETHY